MRKENCAVIENRRVAPGHFILKMRSPRIAKNAKPGQFVQVLCADSYEPLLPRPFSFLTADSKDFSILYRVVGRGTALLQKAKKGDTFSVLGPLGNGFSEVRSSEFGVRRILVGGGVGIPPLYHLTQEWIRKRKLPGEKIHVFLGARHKSFLLCENDFKKLGVTLHFSTDDGSKGKKSFVTGILEDFLLSQLRTPNSGLVYACGPTPMLKAVSLISQKYDVPCEVSVEVPMACGFGACLGCAIKVKDRFAIACMEGPVFKSSELVWD